ncbi:MAG TPA: vanadium-dependent haloperoxidase [Terriglobales bacterium]
MKQESKNRLSRSMRILPAVVLIGALSSAASAQNAVTFWNTIAARTAVQGKATPGMAGMFLAYADLAAFDALNAIHPRFQAYGGIQPAASPGASESAAVAAAMHDVLVHYFPSQAASDPNATPPFIGLDERYADYLASLTDGAAAINAGVQVGQQAAAAMIALRNNDGVFGVNNYVFQTPGPGVYQPTPPFPYPGAQTPWIANMTPFTMSSAGQFLPDEGPTPLSSDQWAEDYNRTKTYGSLTSTARSAEQTTIGLFWTAHPAIPFTGMLNDLATSHALGALDSARLFAMVFAGYSDAFIGCMNAKYTFNFWRPVTAIQEGDTDGNPDTVGDLNWAPLATTPNHPEYPAAHGCVTGAITSIVASYFGTRNVTLHVTATYPVPAALGGGTVTATRTYNSTDDLLNEVQVARIYGGMHFAHSIQQGTVLGQKVARQLARRFFQPLQ